MELENFGIGAMIFSILFCIFGAVCYVGNVVKLTRCDFNAPYKGEIVHAVGLIPAVSIVTVWNNDK